MRCKTCHYSLTNLNEHRCPECGREFDPKDDDSFLPADWKPESKLGLVWSALCMIGGIGAIYLIYMLFEYLRAWAV